VDAAHAQSTLRNAGIADGAIHGRRAAAPPAIAGLRRRFTLRAKPYAALPAVADAAGHHDFQQSNSAGFGAGLNCGRIHTTGD